MAASPSITFNVPGQRVDGAQRGGPAGAIAPTPMGLPGTLGGSVRLGAQRAGGQPQVLKAEPGRDVVVLHLANGPSLVLHPEAARDLLLAQQDGKRPRKREDLPTTVDVQAQLNWNDGRTAGPGRGTERGWASSVLLAGLDVVIDPLKGKAQDHVAGELVRRIDAQVDEGVYRLSPQGLGPLKGQPRLGQLPPECAGQASLVFVHGTFSTTQTGFGKLWTQHPQRVRALFQHYGQRVFALDHRTLGASPVENALTLARACPAGARLHLVTHSRGGLVAEVLARASALASAGGADLARFDAEPATQKALAELVALMGKKGKDIRVERVVRVACPARGTLLASQRLDAYLSVFKWALELANLPVLPELLDFLAGVAQRREDPGKIPGVAAMIPDSALVRWLHAADEPVPGKLFVVAGDLQADSVGSWVKTLLSDAFYRTDHDLVVNTASMYGGAPREGGASFVLDKGGKVTHFNYFANERTAAAVVAALTQDRPEDFRSIGPLSWAGESASGERAARRSARAQRGAAAPGSRPAVFVLPGILGSHLAVDGKRIWLGWRLINGLERLAYPEPAGRTVTPDGAIGLSYEDLMDHLATSHEVIEFSYDWRRPIEQEAQRLGRAVEQALAAREQSGQPVRLLAHSMGGLVARTMQLECPKVWDRLMAHPGARLLMLGTPNGGSWAPMQCLSGDDSFGNTLVAFGAPFQDAKARGMMARFPGFIQLQAGLVGDPRALDKEETWRDLALQDKNRIAEHHWWHSDERQLATYDWGVPPQAVLNQAKALRQRLDAQREQALPRWRDKLALVVGRARFTPDGYELGPDGLDYLNTPESGDGRVPITSALLPKVPTWQLECDHGKLPDEASAFDAYVELLTTGTTAKLPRLAEGTQRGGAGAAVASAPPVKMRPSRQRQADDLPSEDDPLRDILPSDLVFAAPPSTLPLTVTNGDLKFVRQPMLVGHYRSTSLTGTEHAVDRQVGGTMSASLAMGQYPDEPGTHQVFANFAFDPDNPWQLPRPEAVVVVGLGAEGELRPARLSYSVKCAVLAQAQRLVEQPEGAPLQFELAATLLGSGGVGISPGQSAQLIALGVRQADQAIAETNARLQAQGSVGGRSPARLWPRVGRLHLVELYLDRATEAWRALRALGDAMPGQFALAELVDFGTGALRRPVDGGYRGAGYDLISALACGPVGDERILYTADTKRARTEVRAQATQAQLVRELVASASNHAKDDTEIGRTLFQLLVPLELEPYLGSSNEMLLELNPGTAGIPWELLDTDSGRSGQGDHRPWAVRSRLLRKLRLDDFRPGVVDATPDCAALVIGEPECDPSKYPALPGARMEAQAVFERLGAAGALGPDRVKALIRPDTPDATGPGPREVIGALLSRPWRIVHIAGHGEPPEVVEDHDPDSGATVKRVRNPRGVVLAQDTFLGPREIRNLRVVPELVFVNCCHLARRENSQLLTAGFERGDSNPAKFAGTVAEELIRAGVRCVVAAGWAVDDAAAAAFADTLYRSLLAGARFIEAVGSAREAAQRLGGNTWAAYQCYGDPDWTLRPGTAASQRRAQPVAQQFANVASPLTLTLALETLVWQSRYQNAASATQLERIRHLEARFGPQWGGMGAVAEAFAVAYDAAGDRAQAIVQYGRAVAAPDGSATLRASEQLANLQVRQAWNQARGAKAAQADAAQAAIAQALQQLDRLVQMQPTLERHMLRASAHKRLAMIHLAQGRRNDWLTELEAMAQECSDAAKVGVAAGQQRDLHYPLANQLAAEVARHAGSATWAGPHEALVTQLRLALQKRALEEPDFWSVMGQTELRLNLALSQRALQAQADELATELADLRSRVSATEYWSSVADQLDFLLPGYLQRVGAAGEKAAAQRLRELVDGYAGR